MLVTLNVNHNDVARLVATSIHESIRNIARMYDYTDYPESVEEDLAALNRVYQYYSGKEIGNE